MGFVAILPAASGSSINDASGMGLAFWTMPPNMCVLATGNTAANGNLLLGMAVAVKAQTLTKLGVNVVVAGVTPGAGVNRLVLYSSAGALLGQTVDMTAAFQGTGYIEGALTVSVPATAGTEYYLGIVTSFTGTNPTISGLSGSVNLPENIRSNYPNIFFTGQATVPASFTPSAGTANSGSYFLTAGP
jgi:hypothetical protein